MSASLQASTLAALLLVSTSLQGADASSGKRLHAANCTACHEALMNGDPNSMYTRIDRRVRDNAGLRAQTVRCADNLGLQWTGQKVDDVVEYLRREFYKF